MNELIKSGLYDMGILIQINTCRLYLQVLSLADICEGNGHRMSENYLDEIKSETRISIWKWPIIPRPPNTFWRSWKNAMEKSFLIGDSRYLKKK